MSFGEKIVYSLLSDLNIDFIKEYLKKLIHNMGLTCNLEVKKRENGVNYTVIADNNYEGLSSVMVQPIPDNYIDTNGATATAN